MLKRSNTLKSGRDCIPNFSIGMHGRRVFAFTAAGMLALSLASSSDFAYGKPEDAAGAMAWEDVSDSSDSAAKYGDEKIEVDVLAEQLQDAKAGSLVASVEACSMKLRAEAIAARLPEQQERSDKAAQNLYKLQQDSYGVVDMLLNSRSIEDFIQNVDYLHNVTQANVHQIKLTNELKDEAERVQSEFEGVRDKATGQLTDIREQLEKAQSIRIAKASEGIAAAQNQATSVKSSGYGEDGKKKGEERVKATEDTESLDDGADWSQTKEEFVAEWAPRLDNYLKGTPLAGQGENFAKSAWKYCIDPRWSAAISNTESSKGAHCIRPHNAWGWGAADSDPYGLAAEWKSWAEAIDAHAKGLANGYGYTITKSGARMYCPNTWENWYNKTLNEMSKI